MTARSKAPLALMEQVAMILVFSLVAALCVRVFVHCAVSSRDMALEDEALSCAMSVADAAKAGDVEALASMGLGADPYGTGPVALAGYDGLYCEVGPMVSSGLMWESYVAIMDGDGRELARLPICGQIGGVAYG